MSVTVLMMQSGQLDAGYISPVSLFRSPVRLS
jgi:hypothetical protein